MAIFRGIGGSLDGQTETLSFPVAISQGGTGNTNANAGFNALVPSQNAQSGKYLKTNGADTGWSNIDISTSDVTGILPVFNGGTGASTSSDALVNLLPSYTSNANKVLSINSTGTGVEWSEVAGTGTVISVGLAAPTGFDVTNSPITLDGTLTLAFSTGYSLPTNASQSTWDTAYGWGDHSVAGYLLSTTAGTTYVSLTGSYADPTWITSLAGSKISGNISGNAANVTGTVVVANGGTGATTLTGYVKGNGTSAMTASATISGTDIDGGTINGGTY